ncbi:transposase [Arthrobacter sp. UYEF21]
MTGQTLDLKEHPLTERVSLVVMEATSDYWRPFYCLLEGEGLNVILVNARDARNVPGRKTDVSDAAWLADLGAHGLVRASFVPPPPIRELRDLTRARMRSKIPELTEALTGRFSSHHRYMAELYLHRVDAHTADIKDLSARIEAAMEPFRLAPELLISIPGFSTTIAEIFIAETGADMTVFPTAGHLASWAGTSPGSGIQRIRRTG